MKLVTILITALLLMANTLPSPPSPLAGVWTEIDGPGAARIAPCASNTRALCALGLEKRKDGSISQNPGGVVLQNVIVKGKDRWSGTYLNGKQKLPATIKLVGGNIVEMKVCMAAIICQTARYRRMGS